MSKRKDWEIKKKVLYFLLVGLSTYFLGTRPNLVFPFYSCSSELSSWSCLAHIVLYVASKPILLEPPPQRTVNQTLALRQIKSLLFILYLFLKMCLIFYKVIKISTELDIVLITYQLYSSTTI